MKRYQTVAQCIWDLGFVYTHLINLDMSSVKILAFSNKELAVY